MKVGVIGNGFVGNAIYHTFSPQFEVKIFDVNPSRATNSFEDTVGDSNVVFVCVPTPMKPSGEIDLSYIDGVFSKVIDVFGVDGKVSDDFNKETVFVIKSTVVPNTTKNLIQKHDLNIVFSPEFLTERTAVSDSICSNHVVLGGANYPTEIVSLLYAQRFGPAFNIFRTDSTTAEFIKYMRNTFFATKVTYMNEMFRIAVNSGVEWHEAVSGFALDGRIGHSHMNVPGHDGKYGYGGTCFPKDVSAITEHSKVTNGFTPPLLTTIQEANLKYRGVEDWKESKGRAVSE